MTSSGSVSVTVRAGRLNLRGRPRLTSTRGIRVIVQQAFLRAGGRVPVD